MGPKVTFPKISVSMPNYNHAQYIGQAIESILEQSVQPYEVIIVDDGSTDDSVKLIESYARKYPQIKFLKNEKNMGVEHSLRRILQNISGEYILFFSADDKVFPCFFEKSVAILQEFPEAGLCCSEPVTFDGSTGVIKENRLYASKQPCYFNPDTLAEKIINDDFWIAGHTSLIKRSALKEAGDFRTELKWHCDWFAFHVIGFRYGVCYVPEPLSALRVMLSSYSASGKKKKEQKNVLTNILELLKSQPYADVRPMFKKSGILSHFGSQMFWLMLQNPKYIDFLTLTFMRKVLRSEVAKVMPAPVKRTYKKWKQKRKMIRNRIGEINYG